MRYLLLVCFTIWAGLAEAGVIDIRSGEHDGFTRLVFTLPDAKTGWELKGDGTEYTLIFETESPEYVDSTVFDRIPRTRLAALNAERGNPQVVLQLACSCDVEAFAFGGRSVVVDIRTVKKDVPPLDTMQGANAAPTVLRLSPSEQTSVRRKWADPDHFFDEAARKKNQKDQLVRAVARAASQGLVAPNVTLSDENTTKTNREPAEVKPAPSISVRSENLRTETTYDQAFKPVETALSRESCIVDEFVDVASWGSEEGEQELISTNRAALFDEIGSVDEVAVEAYARRLLYQTFGAEARQVLALVPASDSVDILFALADIMDSAKSPAANLFSDSLECEGKSVLWAFLADRVIPSETQKKAILRYFSALPGHLRRHLGPRVAERFLALGDEATADVVSTMIERVSTPDDPQPKFLQARIQSEGGQTTQAEAVLSDMVQTGERITPEALINLVKLYAERDFVPSADMVALLETFALEHRRGALGSELRQAFAIASALAGEFSQAFNVTRQVKELDGEVKATKLRSRLVDRLLKDEDKATILQIAVGRGLGVNEVLDRWSSLRLADRLISMGFTTQAEQRLETVPFQMTEQERLLRARLALKNARPHLAEMELLGVESKEASRLRAKAREIAGAHEKAAVAYEDLGLQSERLEQVWLAGNWTQVKEVGTPPQKAFAEYMTQPDRSLQKEEGPLAKNRAELEQSARLRGNIEDILAQYPPLDF